MHTHAHVRIRTNAEDLPICYIVWSLLLRLLRVCCWLSAVTGIRKVATKLIRPGFLNGICACTAHQAVRKHNTCNACNAVHAVLVCEHGCDKEERAKRR